MPCIDDDFVLLQTPVRNEVVSNSGTNKSQEPFQLRGLQKTTSSYALRTKQGRFSQIP